MSDKQEIKKKPTSFFAKKEGKTGIGFLLAGAAALAIFHQPILEALQSFGQEMLADPGKSALGFGVIGLLVFIASDKRARRLISYGFKGLMRWITSWFTELDPIKILEKYVDELETNFKLLGDNIAKLKNQIAKLKDTVSTNCKEIAKASKLIAEAKRQGRADVEAINLNQIGRLNALNKKYGVLMGKMEDLNNVLIKMHSYSSYKLTDTKNEIRMKKQEFAAISSGYSAMQNAKSIIDGDFRSKELYDTAIENLTMDLSTKIAEMDNFMELSSSVFKDMDLQNSIYKLEGESIFDKITQEGQSFLDKIDYTKEASFLIKGNNE